MDWAPHGCRTIGGIKIQLIIIDILPYLLIYASTCSVVGLSGSSSNGRGSNSSSGPPACGMYGIIGSMGAGAAATTTGVGNMQAIRMAGVACCWQLSWTGLDGPGAGLASLVGGLAPATTVITRAYGLGPWEALLVLALLLPLPPYPAPPAACRGFLGSGWPSASRGHLRS